MELYKTATNSVLFTALVLLVGLVVPACGGDDGASDTSEPAGDVGDDTPPVTVTRHALTFTGSGFSDHEGQVLKVLVFEKPSDAVVLQIHGKVKDGAFTFELPALLEQGKRYKIYYMTDFNNDGACQAPPVDHGWGVLVDTVSGPVAQAVTQNAEYDDDICEDFEHAENGKRDLVFNGTGFGPHEGLVLHALVFEKPDDTVVTMADATIEEGAFSFTFPNLLEDGKRYKIYYMTDANQNGTCEAPPTDHGWGVLIDGVSSDVVQDVVHTTDFDDDICEDFEHALGQ